MGAVHKLVRAVGPGAGAAGLTVVVAALFGIGFVLLLLRGGVRGALAPASERARR